MWWCTQLRRSSGRIVCWKIVFIASSRLDWTENQDHKLKRKSYWALKSVWHSAQWDAGPNRTKPWCVWSCPWGTGSPQCSSSCNCLCVPGDQLPVPSAHEPLRDTTGLDMYHTHIWDPPYLTAAQAPGPKNILLERKRLTQQLGWKHNK